MKKLFIILQIICFFSSATFAQTTTVAEPQPAPVSFKRDNGNGTCQGLAEIRVYFTSIPDYWPTIEEVRSEARAVTGIVVNNIDASVLARKGYLSYCISSADIIPAVKLWIRFHYNQSNQDFWVTESLNPTGK